MALVICSAFYASSRKKGKSTLLNSVAGTVVFKSGVSAGKGLTSQLDQVNVGTISYCDTPGLADDTHRKAAGVAISQVLKAGGPCQIIFVVTLAISIDNTQISFYEQPLDLRARHANANMHLICAMLVVCPIAL